MNIFKKHCFTKRNLGKRKIALILVALVLILGSGAAFYHYQQVANQKKTNLTTNQSLVQAKKELSRNPNDINANLALAYLNKSQHSSQAKKYLRRAFYQLQKELNQTPSSKTTENYWAIAGIAEQAGETSQAKFYYQKVIETASPSNAYEQSLVKQSQVALQRLK